ncbi:RNA polymerase sigma factor RpoE [Guyparkeria hydrothermalis]|uniref:RNA polymerase sigma factor RpoE n=1 Tax=Guyparkeria halophila TaxID=47960 RepID=A0A6I6DA48_9GAMM|nr:MULTISPECIES: RNA polymerase sigma factor RpoE [Guyparkeria]MCL7751212.1 RNA polymerase sigma factor RpoE [Guyparkeria hydrothermalis]QGT78422.1 RNA polymerase sigma factor RpoE [Guyparkeria halophila]TKA89573.1 RNA polymerase sigma factor RpoE [Guyparkeria sp. SB14A]
MSAEENDKALVARARKGDRRAFDLLVLKYQHRVQRLIARYIRDPEQVFDLAQETFIKAYRALERFRGDSAFYTWIYRIAVNTAKNQLASDARGGYMVSLNSGGSDESDEPMIEPEALRDGGTPDALAATEELKAAIDQAISDLPEDLRTALTLREMEGLSYDEIASVMDCPIGTVRSRIFRAREAIEQSIESLKGG